MINNILQGDSLSVLKCIPDETVQTCITSPPYYGLRNYGVSGQIGLEESVDEYITNLVKVFREVRRVLKESGTLWINLGDSYAGSGKGAWKVKDKQRHTYVPDPDSPQIKIKNKDYKSKDLMGIPWRVAFALQDDGWYLRSDIIWHKPNTMPESVTDRPTKAHEYIFLFSKSPKYYYNNEAIKETAVHGDPNPPRGSIGVIGQKNKGSRVDKKRGSFNGKCKDLVFRAIRDMRNKRSVWTVTTKPYKEAHFATYPPDLIEPCVLAGSKENDTVLDPFFGAGTTGLVAWKYNRNFIGIELNREYIKIAKRRLANVQMSFT